MLSAFLTLYMTHNLLIILLSIILSSCSLIHFLSVEDKSTENRSDYQKYLMSYGYDTTNSFQLLKRYYDTISVLPYAMNTYKLKHEGKASPIQIRVYDSTGKFLNGYEQCFGELRRTHILDSFPLKKISHFPINYNLLLKNDIKLFVNDTNEQKRIMSESTNKKYTFIIYYCLWTGYYSNNTLIKFKKHLKSDMKDILLLKVNTSPNLQ